MTPLATAICSTDLQDFNTQAQALFDAGYMQVGPMAITSGIDHTTGNIVVFYAQQFMKWIPIEASNK